VDNLASRGFPDCLSRHGMVGRQLIGMRCVAHVVSLALPFGEGEDLSTPSY
jgi:hypothetical protein